MLTLVQLQDGCYKVIVDYSVDGLFAVHREYTFAVAESDSPVASSGEKIMLKFKDE